MNLALVLIAVALFAIALGVIAAPGIAARLAGIDTGIPTRFGNQAGSVATFIPEVWSKKILSSLNDTHIFATLCNRDYEGEINEAGDTVTINSVSRPTINPYVPNSTTITPEKLTTAQRQLVVDQSDYFAFEVDDVDKRQALPGAFEEATKEAAWGFSEVVDLYIEGLMRAAASNSISTPVALVDEDDAKDVINKLLRPAKVFLDRANCPAQGRWAVLTPEAASFLALDDRFIDASKSGSTDALVNGHVGRALGFDIRVSNNPPIVTGDDSSFLAGHNMATSYAEQINKTEAYRPESSFSDAVKGLHLYGGKVVRPSLLVKGLTSAS